MEQSIINEFTMNGQVNMVFVKNPITLLPSYIAKIQYNNSRYIQGMQKKIDKKVVGLHQQTDTLLYDFLEKNRLDNKKVAVFSDTPLWYELIAKKYGGDVTVFLEKSETFTTQNDIFYDSLKNCEQYEEKFDIVLNMSFVEHLGLKENYSPNADLEFMEKVKKVLKKCGKMLLAVPIGKDVLYFENYRVYGEKRFPRLIEKWKVSEYIGFFDHCLLTSYNNENVAKFQPLVILEK